MKLSSLRNFYPRNFYPLEQRWLQFFLLFFSLARDNVMSCPQNLAHKARITIIRVHFTANTILDAAQQREPSSIFIILKFTTGHIWRTYKNFSA